MILGAVGRSAAGGLGDVHRDGFDLLVAELVPERRHPAAAVAHLLLDLLLRGHRLVEVRADAPGGAGRLERVAAAAAGRREHRRAVRAARRLAAALGLA